MTSLEACKALLSPPGDTLLETIEHLGISQIKLAESLGKNPVFVREIIEGKASITKEVAQELEKLLGISTSFWLERERRYQLELSKLAVF